MQQTEVIIYIIGVMIIAPICDGPFQDYVLLPVGEGDGGTAVLQAVTGERSHAIHAPAHDTAFDSIMTHRHCGIEQGGD